MVTASSRLRSSDSAEAGGAPPGATQGDVPGVLGRSAAVLKCFDTRHPRLTLSDVVRRTGLPKTTVHRLLGELCRYGFLVQEQKEFCIGRRIFELASLSPLSMELREVAKPYMQDLHRVTNETVTLAVRDDTSVLYVEKIRGHREISLLGRVGTRMPLHCTGLGKALLAHAPEELVHDVVSHALAPKTSLTITAEGALLKELRTVSDRGAAFDRGEAAVGLNCVATPILDSSGEAIAAISISIPAGRRRLDQLAPSVQTTAVSISRLLGRRRAV
jgi:DNA-binding IclR family transcriptional regulator